MYDNPTGTAPTHQVTTSFEKGVIYTAVQSLKNTAPEYSAANVLSQPQKLISAATALIIGSALILHPTAAFIVLNIVITVYFILAVLYRLLLMAISWRLPINKANPAPQSTTSELPVITILAPLYHDAEALASLSYAIDTLVYPTAKKDVILLLEAGDNDTLTEAQRLGLTKRYEVIIAPAVGPKTKPKACNIGLQIGRGDLIVIYDAEDQPEKDQLIKAANAFFAADPKLACVQAKLNYYNADENWLTRGIMAQVAEKTNCGELKAA